MVGDEAYAGPVTADVNEMLREIDRAAATISEIVAGGSLREPESE
jgi:hypothetical protein